MSFDIPSRRWGRREFLAATTGLGLTSWAGGVLAAAEVARASCREWTMCLSDGRRVAARRYGNPRGYPVLYFHGIPSARVEADIIADLVLEADVELISIDRPGLGLSSYHGRHSVAGYPNDVRQIITALRAERENDSQTFGILSLSSGTPYALACAEQLGDVHDPNRLIAAVGLMSPRAWRAPGVPDGIHDRTLSQALAHPRLARVAMNLARRLLSRNPYGAVSRFSREDSSVDRRFTLCNYQWSARCALEASRCGPDGLLMDIALQCQPSWRVGFEKINTPIRCRRGCYDRLAWTQTIHFLKQRLPHGDFEEVPNEGHLTVLRFDGLAMLNWIKSHG